MRFLEISRINCATHARINDANVLAVAFARKVGDVIEMLLIVADQSPGARGVRLLGRVRSAEKVLQHCRKRHRLPHAQSVLMSLRNICYVILYSVHFLLKPMRVAIRNALPFFLLCQTLWKRGRIICAYARS